MKTKLTKAERARYYLRVEITNYCTKPRTLEELKIRFDMSGTSISACMSPLIHRWRIIEHNLGSKTYTRIKGKRVPKR
jgi:hypothetical protein